MRESFAAGLNYAPAADYHHGISAAHPRGNGHLTEYSATYTGSLSGTSSVNNGTTPSSVPAGYVSALLYPMPASISTWHESSGKSGPLVITYSFATHQPLDQWNVYTGWAPFTESQKAAVRSVLTEYASMLNVVFVEVSSGAVDPDINFGRVSLPSGIDGQGGFKYTYFTDGHGIVTAKELDGFAVFANNVANISRNTILHEIGHAMTLKHPGNYNAGEGSTPGPYLPASLDSNKYSVMSYHPDPDNHAHSPHLMLLDIAALQQRFGANLSYRTGDDIYKKPANGMQAVWDAGGNDTIYAAAYKTTVKIDLNPGHFSSLKHHHDFAIAYGVVIENAIGGKTSDKLIGNAWNNTLSGNGCNDKLLGGGGDDLLNGGTGKDTLTGGPGADTFFFQANLGSKNIDRVKDFSPADDTIWLNHGVFGALTTGILDSSAFHAGSGAADGNDYIIYNPLNGALYYDPDGSGAGGAIKFAKLSPYLAVTNADFFVV